MAFLWIEIAGDFVDRNRRGAAFPQESSGGAHTGPQGRHRLSGGEHDVGRALLGRHEDADGPEGRTSSRLGASPLNNNGCTGRRDPSKAAEPGRICPARCAVTVVPADECCECAALSRRRTWSSLRRSGARWRRCWSAWPASAGCRPRCRSRGSGSSSSPRQPVRRSV